MRIFRTKPSVDTEASETTIGQENSYSENRKEIIQSEEFSPNQGP